MSTVVNARDFAAFLVAFAAVRNFGVEPTPVGGNEMTLPDTTSFDVLRALAAIDGITVSTDRPEPEPAPPTTTKTRTKAATSKG